MSTTASSNEDPAPVFEQSASRRRGRTRTGPRVPRRHRWGWVVLAVFVIAGAGGGNAWLVSQLDEREPMMVLSHDVAWGQPITGHDVTTVELSPESRGVGISEADWNRSVRGRLAAVPLHAGQLLSRSALSTHTVPGPGQQVVGLRLTAGHYPARGLVPNDPIHIVPVNSQASGDTSAAAGPVTGPGFPARVVRANGPDPDGAVTADVLVDQAHAGEASSAAATGALVTLLGPQQ